MNRLLELLQGRRIWIVLLVVVVLGIGLGTFSKFNATTAHSGILAPLSFTASLGSTPILTTSTSAPLQPVPEVIVLNEDHSQEIEELLDVAAGYFEQQQYARAMVRAQQALRLDPANLKALQLKIRARNAWEDQDTSGVTLLVQANNYFLKGQFDGAALIYNRYMEQHPESRSAIRPLLLKSYYNLGVIALRQARYDVAADYFRQNVLLADADIASQEGLALAQKLRTTPASDSSEISLPSLLR